MKNAHKKQGIARLYYEDHEGKGWNFCVLNEEFLDKMVVMD